MRIPANGPMPLPLAGHPLTGAFPPRTEIGTSSFDRRTAGVFSPADERPPYLVKDDSDSRTEILKLLQSMETKLNCIETCLEKDKGRLLTSIPEQNEIEGISNKFLYTVLGNITDVDWKHLMRILGLTDPEMEGIKRGHLSDVKEQKYQMLQLIKQKKREKGATVTKGEIQQALNILKLTDVLSCTEAGSHVSAPAILG